MCKLFGVDQKNFHVLLRFAITGGVVCKAPSPVPNTIVSVYRDTSGSVATYKCQLGYMFTSGGTTRTAICTGNFKWKPEIPECVGQ